MKRRAPTHATAPDVCVACNASLSGWGGGLSVARGALLASQSIGLTGRLLGVQRVRRGAGVAAQQHDEAPLVSHSWSWRFQHLMTASQLGRWLSTIPRPRRGFVAVSPFWIAAAQRAWPGVPLMYVYPCMLSTCTRFTGGRERSLHARLNLSMLRRIERFALRAADVTLAPTALARDEIIAFEPRAAASTRVGAPGCHAPRIDPGMRARVRAALGFGDAEFVVLLAGVMDRNKAFDLAIRELPGCPANTRLLIVGDGPQHRELLGQVEQTGLRGRITILPAQANLAEPVAACDAVASTSGYDTYPNVLLEGLSAARPIVAPRHDPPRTYAGINELIAHGGGVLFDRSQPGSFAAAIGRLARDRGMVAVLAGEARRLAPRLTWDGIATELARFLSISMSMPQARPLVGKALLEPAHVG